jgi:cytoskeleton protein RodZ
MTDSQSPASEPLDSNHDAGQPSAGALLRQARKARGLHIAALANAIKVSPQKLQLLESDRYDELPDATFTRALAQTVCRFLKIDPAPVMALLPQPADESLVRMSHGLNAPFRDRPGRRVPRDYAVFKNPGVVGAMLIMVAAIVLYFFPQHWVPSQAGGDAAEASPAEDPASAGLGAVDAGSVPELVTSSSISLPTPVAPAASMGLDGTPPLEAASAPATPETLQAAPAATASAPAMAEVHNAKGVLQLSSRGESWIEVTDRRGRPLFARVLHTGETVGLDGPTPLRVTVGNAAVTSVTYKGQRIDLAESTRENVAKLVLR